MDKIHYFKYAFGGIEDITEGNFDRMDVACSLNDLNLDSDSRGIIIPRFVGVYQDWRIKPDTREEENNKRIYEEIVRGLEFLREQLAKGTLENEGIKERVYPKLIHIGYDPRFYNEGLVREFFGRPRRLEFSPYQDLPEFYHKDLVIIDIFIKELEDILREGNNGDGRVTRIEEIAKESYDGLKEQLRRFGLTREEFIFLHIFEDFLCKRTGSEIFEF